MADEETKLPATTTPTPAIQVEFRRDEKEFTTYYANQVQVESNAFDVKLTFGLYDHRKPEKVIIDQFASVNLSYIEAKLLIFWMQVHVDGYEGENGKVKIPPAAIPPDLPPIPPQYDNPKGREVYERMRKFRAEFIAGLSVS